MDIPTSSEVLAAAQVLRRFSQHLAQQQVNLPAGRSTIPGGIPPPELVDPRVLAELQTIDEIIAKLTAWADQLKQRQVIRRSHGSSL